MTRLQQDSHHYTNVFSKLHAGKQTLPDLYSLDQSVDTKNLKNTYDGGDTVPSRSWPSTRRNSPEMSSLWNAMDALDLTEPLAEASEKDCVLKDDSNKNTDINFSHDKSKTLSNRWTSNDHPFSEHIRQLSLDDSISNVSWTEPSYAQSFRKTPKAARSNTHPGTVSDEVPRLNRAYTAPSDVSKSFVLSRLYHNAEQPDLNLLGQSQSRSVSVPGVCHYFLQGYCARGNQCKYAHLINPHVAFPLENGQREPLIEKRVVYSEQVSELIAPHGTFGFTPMARALTHPIKMGRKLGHEAHHFQNAQVSDFIGQIFFLCKDQQGCRFLQKKLDEGNANDASAIFEEVQNHFGELMVDPFGNYLCQKLLEHSNEEQKARLIERVSRNLVHICLNTHGTRAAQKLCESVANSSLVETIIACLERNVIFLIKDLNGNHVVQKCLTFFKPEHNQFIYDSIIENCIDVATHRHGCCVIQRCIDRASEHQKIQLVAEITVHALTLVQNPFGNYVVQYILDLDDARFTNAVVQRFLGNVCLLSIQKFSSNVIEKCIRVADETTRQTLISEIVDRDRLETLLRDSYANYVVQTALDLACPLQRERLIEYILPIIPSIRSTPHGKRLQAKLQNGSSLGNLVSPLDLNFGVDSLQGCLV